MPDVLLKLGAGMTAIMTVGDDYKPGDQAPEGYIAWHEWAEVQHKAGLKQKQCCLCGLWCYPQQLSDETVEMKAKTSRGETVIETGAVCNKCSADNHPTLINGQ